ncbi:MAG: cation-transporting P-type ATPase [Elusimicrobiales bacterium]|jgi:magnesium-transporting ATPase (P-type)
MKFPFIKLLPSLVRQSVKQHAAGMTESDRKLLELCALPAEDALARLATSKDGLGVAEAGARRGEYGFNALSRKEKKFFVFEILERFKNPLAVQLLVIGSISLWMGETRSAAVVGAAKEPADIILLEKNLRAYP